MGGKKTTKGFTLMELMMTLAVVGVILAVAVPSFRAFQLNNRMTSAANDLLASIQHARSEAIKRQRIVALCASANPAADPPSCSASFSGWVVWADADNDATIDGAEEVIASHEALDASLTVTANGNFFSYAPSGFTQDAVGGVDAATKILLCDERGDVPAGNLYRKRVIRLSPTGRPAILRTVDDIDRADPEAPLDVLCGPGP